MSELNDYTKHIKIGRILTLAGYFLLMAGLYSWHLIFDHTDEHLVSLIIIFQLGPLMFPLFGLLNGRQYTHAWSMYLAIFYFIIGVWYSGSEEDLKIGLYVITTSIMFFTGCLVYTRYTALDAKQHDVVEGDTAEE